MLPFYSSSVPSTGSLPRISVPKFLSGGLTIMSETECSNYLQCQNVRIFPSFLTFADAFEGKMYHKKLIIQNCGKTSAFIRICSPHSYVLDPSLVLLSWLLQKYTFQAFRIKALVKGQHLPPGLCIIRYISYTYMCATAVPNAWLQIFINKELVEYKLKVTLSQVMISAIPDKIEFGTINAGHSASVRMLSLRNDGSKGTRFAIDLGRNEFELLVEPTKGIIQPRSVLTFRVECLGTKEGSFSREFWIKCECPLRIEITGDIIRPCFLPYHPNATQDFTLIDFPRTYFGTQCIKTLVIKNYSAIPAVYCTLVTLMGRTMSPDDASKIDRNFLNFKLTPKHGGLLPQEGRIFQFTYKPIKDSKREKKKFSFCCLQVIRVSCITVNQIETSEIASIQDTEQPSHSQEISDSISINSTVLPSEDESVSVALPDFPAISYHDFPRILNNSVRVMLYGEAETAGIVIRPDALNLLNIPHDEPTTRELLLQNTSLYLPIIFKYNKVCSVEVEPSTGQLPASGKIEVNVIVTPVRLGTVSTKIVFDLLFYNRPFEDPDDYVLVGREEVPLVFNVPSAVTNPKIKFNMGITPMYIKDVGMFADNVKFNNPIEMPNSTMIRQIHGKLLKNDNDFIAFPNDRPKSLRYHKSFVGYRTICAGIPRVVSEKLSNEYELTESKNNLKQIRNSYYKKFTKEEAERLRELREVSKTDLPDYDISSRKALCGKVKKVSCDTHKKEEDRKNFPFIPLMPSQLFNVEVHPIDIKLGKIAPNTSTTRTISVNNQNKSSIRIHTKPRKPVLTFPDGDHKIAKPFQEVHIKFTFNSGIFVGRSNVLLDVIINDNHSYVVSITADVIPKLVKFDLEEIVFNSDGNRALHFDIRNPVNLPVEFRWQIPESCFTIEPQWGTVPPKRRISCCVTYHPHYVMPSATEVTLHSDNSRHQVVYLMTTMKPPKIVLKNKVVDFKSMPLNLEVEKKITIKNLGMELVTFAVLNPEPMDGIKITPIDGVFRGCSEQTFRVKAKIPACISFECVVQVELQCLNIIKFKIIGNVVYPNVIVKPNQLSLERIVPNCFNKEKFAVINKSPVDATVEFSFKDYPEYSISNNWGYDWEESIEKIELKPNEQKQLVLHFNPIGAGLYSFYLPTIINGVLGPPLLNIQDTLRPSFYTEQSEKEYIDSNQAKGIKMPEQLSTLIVSSVTTKDLLRFSKLLMKFTYFPNSEFLSETSTELTIWNGSKDACCQFCIRTDELCQPFSLRHINGAAIELLEYSIICTLEPNEDVTFKADFFPSCPGTYRIRLPVYVRHYRDCNVFNYIQLHGWYPEPLIELSEDNIAFEPTPLRCYMEYKLFARVCYHGSNCKVYAESNFSELKINLRNDSDYNIAAELCREIPVILKCFLENVQSFDTRIRFFCTCGSECITKVTGCSDNCSVTTHAFFRSGPKIVRIAGKSSQCFSDNTQEPSITNQPSMSLTLSSTPCLSRDRNPLESNVNFNETCFPHFPDDQDQTDYAVYMRSVLVTLEEWLCYQGFYGKIFYKIPEDIAMCPEKDKQEDDKQRSKMGSDKKKKKGSRMLKFVQLLTNLVGAQISYYVPIREIPEDDIQRINYMYNVYSSSKKIIINQGGLLAYVSPENLLEYADYVIFKKEIQQFRPDYNPDLRSTILEESDFYRLTKQSWIDLLLQTFKVFVLFRVKFMEEELSINSIEEESQGDISEQDRILSDYSQVMRGYMCRLNSQRKSLALSFASHVLEEKSESLTNMTFWKSYTKSKPRNTSVFNESECILLHWLQYNFNKYKEDLWGFENEMIPEDRNIQFFDSDLTDSLVFMVVTYVYCPYLRTHLTDVYLRPNTMEELYHNSSKLLQCWNLLGLSFILTGNQIVQSNGLQMLMLVTYLYEVLPNFHPNNVINLRTGLSTSCSEDIKIQNLSNFPIRYRVIFFGNEREYFKVPKEVVDLQSKRTGKIKVTFHARKMELTEIVLILNGESFGHHYAKTMAFKLIGEPILSYCTTTITIPITLYQVLDIDLAIQSPYLVAALYDTHYSLIEPTDVRTFRIVPWDVEKKRRIPKRIMISDPTEVQFNDDGIGHFVLTVCSCSANEKPYWLFFTNPDVGDFVIKVIASSEVKDDVRPVIPILLPATFCQLPCTCRLNGSFTNLQKTCPRLINIQIPCKNNFLWNAIGEMLVKVVEEKDIPFWRQYVGTNAGIQTCKWMLHAVGDETTDEISEIFNTEVNYTIEIDGLSKSFSIATFTTITNVQSKGYHEIPIHINDTKSLSDFQFTMRSENNVESRHYRVTFLINNNNKECSSSGSCNSNNDMLSECVITDSE